MASRALGKVGLTLFATATMVGLLSSQAVAKKRPIDAVKDRVDATAPETTRKIIGGDPAPEGKYPFQVALIVSTTPEGSELVGQFCGGSLIDKRWVLTAAHCVPDTNASEVDVYIGSTVLPGPGGDSSEGRGIRVHIDDIIMHHEYDSKTHNNDLALLKLVGPTPADLKPAQVATREIQETAGAIGETVTVIGWGVTAEGGSPSQSLLEVDVAVQDPVICEKNINEYLETVFPGSGTVEITPNMFCAGVPSGGKDSCQGDSGGYLGAQIEGETKLHVQLGVVSWGIGCARANLFGVYTRVSNYKRWISEVLANN